MRSAAARLRRSAADTNAEISRSTYRDPRGKVRDWEHAERAHRAKSSSVDGVGIVAVIEKETGISILHYL